VFSVVCIQFKVNVKNQPPFYDHYTGQLAFAMQFASLRLMSTVFKIGQTVADIYGDLSFFKMAAVRHLRFLKFKFFNGLVG